MHPIIQCYRKIERELNEIKVKDGQRSIICYSPHNQHDEEAQHVCLKISEVLWQNHVNTEQVANHLNRLWSKKGLFSSSDIVTVTDGTIQIPIFFDNPAVMMADIMTTVAEILT